MSGWEPLPGSRKPLRSPVTSLPFGTQPFFCQPFKKLGSFLNSLENGTSPVCRACTWVCWGEPRTLRTCSECVPVPSAASRGRTASRRRVKAEVRLGIGGRYPRNPRAQLLKSSHAWGGFEKGGWGSRFPTWLAGLRSAGEAQLQGQRLPASAASTCTWLSSTCTGRRGRVFGPAFVFSALVSVLLALLLPGEPTSSYKTINSPKPYCVN